MTYTYYDYLENYYDYLDDYYMYYSNGTYNGTLYNYTSPYNMDVITPPLWGISILCAILSITIVVITFYQMYSAKKVPKIVFALTSFCLISHLALNVVDPFCYYAWFINFAPKTDIVWDIYRAWDVFWVLSKVSLYILFMYRYYTIYVAAANFNKDAIMYSKISQYIIFGTFTLMSLTQIVLISLYCHYYDAYIQNGYDPIAERLYLNYSWSFLALDLLLVGLLSYLLIGSIIKLIVDIDNSHEDIDNSKEKKRISMKTHNKMINLELSTMNATTSRMEDEISAASGTNTSDVRITRLPAITGVASEDETKTSDVQTPENVVSTTATMSMEIKSEPQRKFKKKRDKSLRNKSREQAKLLTAATRICVTCAISMISSLVWQLLWLIGEEIDHSGLLWLTYTWCVDAVINLFCVYLSMAIAEKHYKYICKNICKCHGCCLKCIIKIVDCQIRNKK